MKTWHLNEEDEIEQLEYLVKLKDGLSISLVDEEGEIIIRRYKDGKQHGISAIIEYDGAKTVFFHMNGIEKSATSHNMEGKAT